MASPEHPKVPGALSLIAEQLPKWWSDPQTADLRQGVGMVVPQDAVDAGMMLLGGPGGKLARKVGAGLIAGGASTDANAGIYSTLPSKLKGIVEELANLARAAHPKASIEFANNGVNGQTVRGIEEAVHPSQLKFTDYGTALHTHPAEGPSLPSFKDFEEWSKQPAQQYLGVVRPQETGTNSAVVIAPKRKPLPSEAELKKFQMSLFKSNPDLAAAIDKTGDDASTWKWLLDAGARDDIDLYLHNTPKPPFRHATGQVPMVEKAGPVMSPELQAAIDKHVDYNGGVSPLLQQHLDAGRVLTAPKSVYRVIGSSEKELNLRPGDVYNFDVKNPSTSQSLQGIRQGVLPGLDDAGFALGDNASLFKVELPAGEAFGQAVRSNNHNRVHDLQDEFLLRKSPPIEIKSIDPDGTINGTALLRDGEHFAQGGPVKPTHNQDQMTHKRSSSQDQSTQPLTGSAIQALLRGWAAGTAGLPGDLEGLARKGINFSFGPGGVNVNPDSTLPTSNFYKEWLPGKQSGDENVTEVGSLFGGAGATKLASPIAKGAGALTRIADAAATKGGMALERGAGKLIPQIMERGGLPAQLLNDLALGTQSNIIKRPGGNWLSGSVEDALKELKRNNYASLEDAVEDAGHLPDKMALYHQDTALDNFIDKQLTRYVKNDMATERDPIRALAEQGTLHVNPEQLNFRPELHGKYLAEGQTAVAKSDAAKVWEGAADLKVSPHAAEWYQYPEYGYSSQLKKDPWLSNVPAETAVHDITEPRNLPPDLGFDHLVDELRNAVNPNSGLPEHLLIRPESMDRMSVPQAVQRVADINAWRAAQKAETDAKLANNAATVLHKEYPDAATNPKGLKWVELKGPGKAPEGWSRTKPGEEPEIDPDFSYNRSTLQDALKYEGDTMGHCVGGYCDSVADGSTRIFSLRDAKGQPHVTIETRPPIKAPTKMKDAATYENEFLDWAETNGKDEYSDAARAEFDAKVAKSEPLPSIVQIKGKGNGKPNADYLPFVQDFVKSGKWGEVGDLQNTDLVRYKGEYVDPASIKAMQAEAVKYMETHPAFEQARQASIERNSFKHNYGTPEYAALEKANGQPIHPSIPYTYDEMIAVLARPEENHVRHGDLAEVLDPAFDRVKKLKEIYGELPPDAPPQGYAKGGVVQRFANGGEVGPIDTPVDTSKATPQATSSGVPSGMMLNPLYGQPSSTNPRDRNDAVFTHQTAQEQYIPIGMMANPNYGAFVDWRDPQDRTTNTTDKYVTDTGFDRGYYDFIQANPGQYGKVDVVAPKSLTDLRGYGNYDTLYATKAVERNDYSHGDPRFASPGTEYGKPIGYKYDNGHSQYVYLDADGNVTSTQDRGDMWTGFRDGFLKPAAAMAAMAYGIPMAEDALGTTAALPASQVAAAGSSVVTPASGVAGWLGMDAGMGATALNTGVLNAGMTKLRGGTWEDAAKSGLIGAALSPVGTMAGDAATSTANPYITNPDILKAIGTTAAGTAIGTGQALLTGQPVGTGFTQGFVNGLVNSVGNYAGDQAKGYFKDVNPDASNTTNNFVGSAANTLTQGTLRGTLGNQTLQSLADQYASGQLTDLTGLPANVASQVVALARGKTTPVGALTTVATGIATSPSPTKAYNSTIDGTVNAVNQVGAVGSKSLQSMAVGG